MNIVLNRYMTVDCNLPTSSRRRTKQTKKPQRLQHSKMTWY